MFSLLRSLFCYIMLQTHEEEFSFNKGSNACLQIIMIIEQIDFVS